MRENPDCRLPNPDLPSRDREGLYGWLMDLCGLAAIGLFVAAVQLWCGGFSS